MSKLNALEKLLDGAEVVWKTFGEITLPTSNIKWRDTNRTYRYIDLTSCDIETKAITETLEIASSNAPSRAQKLVEKDDVLFATTRPAQQRYGIIDGRYEGEVASTGYCVLRAKQDEVLPKWILHWIASVNFKIYDEENQSGSGFAKYLRDALPNASYIGFTGTPIESTDVNTPAVFGDYIDVYDIHRAVEDEATVPIYYESRIAKLDLDEDEKPRIDAEIEELTEDQEQDATEKTKGKWSRIEALVGSEKRIKLHFCEIYFHLILIV